MLGEYSGNNTCPSGAIFRIRSSHVNLNWLILLQANLRPYGSQVFFSYVNARMAQSVLVVIAVVVVVVVVEVVVGLVNLIPLRLSYEAFNTREKRQRQGGSLDRTAELQTCQIIIN